MFIRSFLDGVPRSAFAKGFTRKYHLGSCDVTFEAFDSSPGDVAAYRNACLSALQKPRKPDLAFVITSEEQEALRGNDSPYLVCKSVFMGQGVPVQNVQIETVRRGRSRVPARQHRPRLLREARRHALRHRRSGSDDAGTGHRHRQRPRPAGQAHRPRTGRGDHDRVQRRRQLPALQPVPGSRLRRLPGRAPPVAGVMHRACQGTQRLAAGRRAPAHLPCLQAAEGHRGQGREGPRRRSSPASTRRWSSPSSP